VTATGQPLPLSPTALAQDKWLSRFRTILVIILGGAVTGIGMLAFYTSFEAIKSYAERSSGISPEHAWAIPLLVDSFIVVATGADLWFTTTKQQRRIWEIYWPKALLAGAAGVSFILNVAHAESGNWAARGVAAIPPAALILGVELLMMVLRRATTIRAARFQAELDKQQLELAALQAPPVPVRGEITRKPRKRREIPVPTAEVVDTDQPESESAPKAESAKAGAAATTATATTVAAATTGTAAETTRNGSRDTAAATTATAGAGNGSRDSGRDAGRDDRRDPNVPIFTPVTPTADKQRPRPAATRAATTAPSKAASGVSKPVVRPDAPEAGNGDRSVFSSTRLRGGKRPGALDKNGKPLTPYVVAARILDERDAKESLTAEQLVRALADEGLSVTTSTAEELLGELRPRASSRTTSRRSNAAR
jgi:uncharacterized protein DUF2637